MSLCRAAGDGGTGPGRAPWLVLMAPSLCLSSVFHPQSVAQSPPSRMRQCHELTLVSVSGIVPLQPAWPSPPFLSCCPSGHTGESLATVTCRLLLCNREVVISSLTPALGWLLGPRLIKKMC